MAGEEFDQNDLEEALEAAEGGGPFVSWADYLIMKAKYEELLTPCRPKVKVVDSVRYRGGGAVDQDYDMIRITLAMTRNDWHALQRALDAS